MPSWSGAVAVALLCAGGHAASEEPARTIATIDFFGLRTISEAQVRQHLPLKEGDRLPDRQHRPDGEAIARALGVSRLTLAYICCTAEQQILMYVGVAEKPAPAGRILPAATGKARLPEEMILADEELGAQVREAIARGQAQEDDSQGHALGAYPPLRAIQQKFIDYARQHVALASEVLATSADARHRAVAASILGYAPDKRAAARALSPGVLDVDGTVRNNATRALGVIATYSAAHPDLGIRIDPEPFVAMLNSVIWTDVNKALFVLVQLTTGRDAPLLKQLREQARPALIDTCRWQNAGHSLPGCLILRRVEGLPDAAGPDDRAEVLRKVGASGTLP
jgi:hypothetical protein